MPVWTSWRERRAFGGPPRGNRKKNVQRAGGAALLLNRLITKPDNSLG